MSFINNLSDKLNGAGNAIANKTRNMGQVMDLESKISGYQKQLTEEFGKLGLFVYENNFEIDNQEYKDQINQIHSIRNAIAEAQGRIKELKEQKICPYCGKVLEGTPAFCSFCGKALNVTMVDIPKKFCPKCGTEVDIHSAFCTKCGCNIAASDPDQT